MNDAQRIVGRVAARLGAAWTEAAPWLCEALCHAEYLGELAARTYSRDPMTAATLAAEISVVREEIASLVGAN